MSSLEKLSIRGVRSFSPDRDESIEFYHPLTVIVGANGTGKTTVIECLKYSCTGSFPPTTRGAGFVHDPKIEGSTETKASIKLRFRNRGGQQMLVIRSLQLVQMKTRATFKALDGVIRTLDENKQRISIGHKCAELDRLMPDLMGVSKSILENVIFCHQEDSSWPLQEGSVLKKKFDDIFESARYTKALEAIKKLKKEQASVAKDHKRDLDVLDFSVREFNDLESKKEFTMEKRKLAMTEIQNLESHIESSEKDIEKVEQEYQNLNNLEAELNRSRAQVRDKEVEVERAYEHIADSVVEGTDEELMMILEKFDSSVTGHSARLASLRDEKGELDKKQQSVLRERSELSVTQGKLEAALEQQESMVRERRNLVNELAFKYGMTGFSQLSTSENDMREFTEKFKQQKDSMSRAIEETKAKNRSKDDSISDEIVTKKAALSSNRDQVKAKKEAIRKAEVEISSLLQSEQGGSATQGEISEVKMRLEQSQQKLEAHRQNNDVMQLKESIQQYGKKLNDLNFESEQLDNDLKVLRLHAQSHANLKSRRESLSQRKSSVMAKISSVDAECIKLIGNKASFDVINNHVQAMRDCVNEKDATRSSSARKVKELEYKMNLGTATARQLNKEVISLSEQKEVIEAECIRPLTEFIEENGFDKNIRELESLVMQLDEAVAVAKEDEFQAVNNVRFFNSVRSKGEKNHNCPICRRDMNTEELKAFTTNMEEKTSGKRHQEKVQKAKKKLAEAESQYKMVSSKVSKWKDWMRIEDILPSKVSELDKLQLEKEQYSAELKELERSASSDASDFELSKKILNSLESFEQDKSEISRMEMRLQDDEESLALEEVESLRGKPRSLEQAESEREELRLKIQQANRDLQSKQTSLQTNSESLQKLQNDVFKKQKDVESMEELLRTSIDAKEKRERLRSQVSELKALATELEEAQSGLERDLQIKLSEKAAWREQSNSEEFKVQQELSLFLNDHMTFENLNRRVETELNYNRREDLSKLKAVAVDLQQREDAVQKEMEILAPELKAVESEVDQHEGTKKQIRGNIEYRNLKKQLAEFESKLKDIKQQMREAPSKSDIETRLREAKENSAQVKDERSMLKGKTAQLSEILGQYEQRLADDKVRNSKENHRKKLIDYETTQMAVDDLEKYYKAVDMALVEFHHTKIKDINAIIKDLWQLTYRGQDIEMIEIKSGQDAKSSGKTGYNYRINMRKGGTWLEMRGRCSAGQRVLAALVIRLALAETFCINCGILALDEPTTNLDTENKLGLAQAMSDVLVNRSRQRNFQLVCITHDEEFVSLLGQAQSLGQSHPEYYWRISREELADNKFYSKIERMDWGDE